MYNFQNESGTVIFNNKRYAFVLDGQIVKLFVDGKVEFHKNIIKVGYGYDYPEQVIFGETNEGYYITFFVDRFYYSFDKYIYFSPYNYIKGVHNATKVSQEHFNKIEFTGDIINLLYDTQMGWLPFGSPELEKIKKILIDQGVKNYPIVLTEYKDLVKEYSITLFGKQITLKYSIECSIEGYQLAQTSTNPVKCRSVVSMIFDRNQNVEEGLKYVELFKKLLSFLLQNLNVDFNAKFFVEDEKIVTSEIGNLHKHMEKEIFYSPKYRLFLLDFIRLGDSVTVLLDKLSTNTIRVDHLPKNEQETYFIDSNRIVAVCTAMEYQYQRLNKKVNQVDKIIKKIKKIIKEDFTNKQITQTQLDYFYGNIKHWSIPAVEQFETLFKSVSDRMKSFIKSYNENKDVSSVQLLGNHAKSYDDFIDDVHMKEIFQEYINVRNLHVHSNTKKIVTLQNCHALTHNLLLATLFANDLTIIDIKADLVDRFIEHYYSFR